MAQDKQAKGLVRIRKYYLSKSTPTFAVTTGEVTKFVGNSVCRVSIYVW